MTPMPVAPVVRYMLLCNDWIEDPLNPRLVNIIGLLTTISSGTTPPYPLRYPEIFVFLALTACVSTKRPERGYSKPPCGPSLLDRTKTLWQLSACHSGSTIVHFRTRDYTPSSSGTMTK